MPKQQKAVRAAKPSALLSRDGAPEIQINQTVKDNVACLAYHLWLDRGCPEGDAEQDWYEAERTLVANGNR